MFVDSSKHYQKRRLPILERETRKHSIIEQREIQLLCLPSKKSREALA